MPQSESEARWLCVNLLRADTEIDAIDLLRHAGYWNDSDAWRPFGDREDNFSTIGNQARNADVPLVEKLVNSVDAVLMGECWSAGIQPNSPEAPRSIQEAVAEFFFGDRSKAETFGSLTRWDPKTRRDASDRITLAATGSRSNPSFTIVDDGEGQTPDSMPDTLLSLDKQNKVNVHFVQGKFNMGGTGALRFCGDRNLQLVISRRNPHIENVAGDPSAHQWGFTVVRRENPTESKRVSTYRYLAPVEGGVLHFESESLALFPQGNKAYVRPTGWGTAVKLYEYRLKGRSHVLRRDGLLSRLDILLPGIALPVRLHECRNYEGGRGSYDTTLNGLSVRLSDDRNENLEPGFPTSSTFTISGQEITAEIYAFKREKANSYRNNEGIVFTVNGQTHGSIPRTFFSRKSVRMNRLEDSILVILDCSRIDGRPREDLFMNSRDRLEQGDFLKAIEDELEGTLKTHQLLRDLKEQRRREDVASRVEDSKRFEDMLQDMLRKSPALAALFGRSGPLSDPFRRDGVERAKDFVANPFPTFFRFQKLDYGKELRRETPANMRSRVVFETDVKNDYFARREYGGKGTLRSLDGSVSIPNHTLNLQDGVATLNLALPTSARVNDSFRYEIVVDDETLVEPFINRFTISVGRAQKSSGGSGGGRRSSGSGQGGSGDALQGLAIPTPIPVYERDWEKHGFDRDSALKVIDDSEDEGPDGYTFYINMDNLYLKTDLKATRDEPEIVKAKWQYGMVLIGMALLRKRVGEETSADGERESDALSDVSKATAAIAPVLLPLIEHLGAMSEEDFGT